MIQTAIFDMDGLLIDSEPLWYEAAVDVFTPLGIDLSPALYAHSVGLRTKEFVEHWFKHYTIDPTKAPETIEAINDVVIEKIKRKGEALPGVNFILDLLRKEGIKIGLATSSPNRLIDVIVDKLDIRSYFSAFCSAEQLEFGKPHPQVYLDCASALKSKPIECICFEDSFYGMIAAKAARMKCVVIPHADVRDQLRFKAADYLLTSLDDFSKGMLV